MDLRRLAGWPLLWTLALVPGLSVAAGKCERLIATGSPDAPPYLWQDPQDPKHLIGAGADLLAQVGQELGIKIELLYAGKRAQALDEVRSGRMDLLTDAPLTVTGLEVLDYVHPPLLENDYLVWTRKDSTLVIDQPADLHGHPGALSEKARMTQEFGVFAERQLSLVRTPNLTQAFRNCCWARWNMSWRGATRAWQWRRHWGWPMTCKPHRNRWTNPGCSSRFPITPPAMTHGYADSWRKR